jgi:hypothetical protein
MLMGIFRLCVIYAYVPKILEADLYTSSLWLDLMIPGEQGRKFEPT